MGSASISRRLARLSENRGPFVHERPVNIAWVAIRWLDETIRLNLHGQPCSLGKRHTVAAAFRATNHGTDVAERSRKTDRAVAPVPFRAPYSRIGNLMAELPYSFIYELRSTPAAPKPYLTGLRRPSAERTTTQICESPANVRSQSDR